MDIDMPVMNGFEASTTIYDFYSNLYNVEFEAVIKRFKIIACTAYADENERNKAK